MSFVVQPAEARFSWLIEQMSYDPKNANWPIAIVAAILGACFGALGLVAQKQYFVVENVVSDCRARFYWYMGLILVVIVAAPFDMGAMAFGSLDLVVPFTGLTLVTAVILAKLCLQESVSLFHMCATLLTAAGVALTAAFGAKSTKFYTALELEDFMLSAEFAAHMSLSITVFTLFAVVGLKASTPRGKLWALSFASMAAIAGAHTYLLLKALADFLSNQQWRRPIQEPVHLFHHPGGCGFVDNPDGLPQSGPR